MMTQSPLCDLVIDYVKAILISRTLQTNAPDLTGF